MDISCTLGKGSLQSNLGNQKQWEIASMDPIAVTVKLFKKGLSTATFWGMLIRTTSFPPASTAAEPVPQERVAEVRQHNELPCPKSCQSKSCQSKEKARVWHQMFGVGSLQNNKQAQQKRVTLAATDA
eukprot:1134319-Pelagomonas_calceolata.AAC.5